MRTEKYSVILVGAGDRGMIYALQSLVEDAPFEIAAVAEPDPERRNAAGELFHIPPERRFERAADAAALPKFADAVFNCTMDNLHKETSLPFLEKGYHMLLEKPIATNEADAAEICERAKKNRCRVMVCHVLRYAPFYTEIKRQVLSGALGEIIHIQMAEQVSYYHMSVSYVRGKYGDPEICGSGMLVSKCSHDLDIMAWLLAGKKLKEVYSAGSLKQYTPEQAPEGAAERCLPDCPHRESCVYSAGKLYVEHPQRWANRVWNDCGLYGADDERKLEALAGAANRYGRCVYRTGMKVVDHQSVLSVFEDGTTGTLSMTGGAAAAGRDIHIIGTKGELRGSFGQERFTVYTIAPEAPGGRTEKVIDVSGQQKGDAHGGGDERLLRDFWALLNGEQPSICCTDIEDSLAGHAIAYRAEEHRRAHT